MIGTQWNKQNNSFDNNVVDTITWNKRDQFDVPYSADNILSFNETDLIVRIEGEE